MDWIHHLLPGLIGAVGVPLLLYLFGLLLSRDRTYGLGYKAGRFLTLIGQKKLGQRSWDQLENRVQATVGDFVDGIYAGMESDDAEQKN